MPILMTSRASMDFFLPSPLVGEGGEIDRREIEPGEGSQSVDKTPHPARTLSAPPSPARGEGKKESYFFPKRSTKDTPPFILWISGASLIWITTASGSTPRFFTNACVTSRIIATFCSSVRPAAMLMVISGIFYSCRFVRVALTLAGNPFFEEMDARVKPTYDKL